MVSGGAGGMVHPTWDCYGLATTHHETMQVLDSGRAQLGRGAVAPPKPHQHTSTRTLTVESSSEAASSLPLGLTRTHSTSSVICSVLQGEGVEGEWGRVAGADSRVARHTRACARHGGPAAAGRTRCARLPTPAQSHYPAPRATHRVWLMPSCLAPVASSTPTPHSQNLMSWSALPAGRNYMPCYG